MLFIHSTPDDHRLWLFETANRALMNAPGEEFYRALSVPTLISGTEDRSRPGAFESADHACNIEVPAEYDAHCIRFLKSRGLFPS